MEFKIENERIYAGDGKVLAEITFPTKDGVATIDHTFVDNSLRGQGIAGQLVRLAADKILADGNRIAATCSYAAAWLQRHPEYPVVDNGAHVSCRLDRRR